MAAPVFESSATASGSSSTLDINKPTGTVEGDLLVAHLYAITGGDSLPDITAPTGWTFIRKDSLGNNRSQGLFYKVAGASEPSSYTFSDLDDSRGDVVANVGAISRISGVDTTSPIDVHGGQTETGTSVTAPDITTAVGDALILHLGAINNGSTFTPPTGYTEEYDHAQGTSAAQEGSWDTQASAGSTGTASATASSSGFWIAAHVAIAPGVSEQILEPSSIASAEVFGTPNLAYPQELSPSAIPSGELFGAAILIQEQFVDPTAIATQEAFGAHTVIPGAVSVLPSAIVSQEAFGTPDVVESGFIEPVAIDSEEAFGTAVLAGPITAIGIPTAEVFGSPTLSPGAVVLLPTGIESSEAFGVHTLGLYLSPTAIGTAEAFGTPTLQFGPVFITPVGIESVEAFGTINLATLQFIQPTGIASAMAFGQAIISVFREAIPGEPPVLHHYTVVIRDLSGDPIEEIPAKNLQYGFTLNGPGSINFTMAERHPKCTPDILSVGNREIVVYRDSGIAPVWGGYLWTASTGGEDSIVRFGGEGWFSRLKYRFIDQDINIRKLDQLDLAWLIIKFTQEKDDLGIRRFDRSESGVDRDRSYWAYERRKIADVLVALAGLQQGFDFEITGEKFWKTYYPKKGVTLGHVFETGKNIGGVSAQYDATKLGTYITAIGEGEGKDTMMAEESVDNEYGLMEDTVVDKDIRIQGTLQDLAAEELRLRKRPRVQPQLQAVTEDPAFGQYSVGDEVLVKATKGYDNINEFFRILSIQVSVANSGREAFTVFFDRALTE